MRLMSFAKALWREALDDNIVDGAAVLAYFFLLGVFPAALFILSLLPSLSIPHLQEAILNLLHQVLPEQSANLFEITVRYVASKAGTGVLTLGLLFTLWSSSTGVYAIMEQLNAIYHVRDRRPFWQARGLALIGGYLWRGSPIVGGIGHWMESAITYLFRDLALDHYRRRSATSACCDLLFWSGRRL
jgi:YihY family inner membrane protein